MSRTSAEANCETTAIFNKLLIIVFRAIHHTHDIPSLATRFDKSRNLAESSPIIAHTLFCALDSAHLNTFHPFCHPVHAAFQTSCGKKHRRNRARRTKNREVAKGGGREGGMPGKSREDGICEKQKGGKYGPRFFHVSTVRGNV